jgi:hypothetical protein
VINESFKPFYKNGIIVQMDGDSGDSCQRVGTYLFLNWIVGIKDVITASDMFYKLQSSRGRFRRTNDLSHWGSRPSNLSRDQLSVMRLALSVYKSAQFNTTYLLQLKRFGFNQNFLRGTDDPDEKWKCPDVMQPEELTCWIRHNDFWMLYPLVFCIDFLFLIYLLYRDPKSWDSDNMTAQKMYYAVLNMPTPVAKLAFALYTKTNYLDCIDNYYAASNNGIPPMAELYREADKKVREKLWENTFWLRWFF